MSQAQSIKSLSVSEVEREFSLDQLLSVKSISPFPQDKKKSEGSIHNSEQSTYVMTMRGGKTPQPTNCSFNSLISESEGQSAPTSSYKTHIHSLAQSTFCEDMEPEGPTKMSQSDAI